MNQSVYKINDQQMIHYTVEALLEGIKLNDSEILQYIYRKFYPSIKFFILKNNGTEDDAKDVFQEAIILIYKKIKLENLVITSTFKTYIYSICRFIWLRQLEKGKKTKSRLVDNSQFVDVQDNYDELLDENEKYKLYQDHFKGLNEDCQKILRLFLDKVPLKDIASIMGFKSVQYAKKRKFQCKEMLVKRIQNDSKYKNLKNGK